MTEVDTAVPALANAAGVVTDAVTESQTRSHDQEPGIEEDAMKATEEDSGTNNSVEDAPEEKMEKLQERERLVAEVSPEKEEDLALKDQPAMVAGKAEAEQDDGSEHENDTPSTLSDVQPEEPVRWRADVLFELHG